MKTKRKVSPTVSQYEIGQVLHRLEELKTEKVEHYTDTLDDPKSRYREQRETLCRFATSTGASPLHIPMDDLPGFMEAFRDLEWINWLITQIKKIPILIVKKSGVTRFTLASSKILSKRAHATWFATLA